jgi:transketolase
MRLPFFTSLYQLMKQDENVILLMADTGAIVMDDIRADFPGRCINVGIAEENMIGVAAGLAMNGKIVYTYAIIPFSTMRCFEQIRVDLCVQRLPVKVIGVGAGIDYSTLGPTHHGLEDICLMRVLPDITILSPCDDAQASIFARLAYETPGPVYIRLDRNGQPLVYQDSQKSFSEGLNVLREGKDLCLIATGKIVLTALQVTEELAKRSINASIVDLYRIKPLNIELVLKAIGNTNRVVTLEEHSIIGGIGSAVAEVLAESGHAAKLRRIGLPDSFCRRYGTRQFLQREIGIDAQGIIDTLLEMVSS